MPKSNTNNSPKSLIYIGLHGAYRAQKLASAWYYPRGSHAILQGTAGLSSFLMGGGFARTPITTRLPLRKHRRTWSFVPDTRAVH